MPQIQDLYRPQPSRGQRLGAGLMGAGQAISGFGNTLGNFAQMKQRQKMQDAKLAKEEQEDMMRMAGIIIADPQNKDQLFKLYEQTGGDVNALRSALEGMTAPPSKMTKADEIYYKNLLESRGSVLYAMQETDVDNSKYAELKKELDGYERQIKLYNKKFATDLTPKADKPEPAESPHYEPENQALSLAQGIGGTTNDRPMTSLTGKMNIPAVNQLNQDATNSFGGQPQRISPPALTGLAAGITGRGPASPPANAPVRPPQATPQAPQAPQAPQIPGWYSNLKSNPAVPKQVAAAVDKARTNGKSWEEILQFLQTMPSVYKLIQK